MREIKSRAKLVCTHKYMEELEESHTNKDDCKEAMYLQDTTKGMRTIIITKGHKNYAPLNWLLAKFHEIQMLKTNC